MARLLALGLLLLAPAAGAPSDPEWGRVDPTYDLQGSAFTAIDGGGSQGDRYLLSREPLRDFALTWDVTRRQPVPGQDRAIVCWSVDAASPANRRCFFLTDLIPDVGRPHRFRLVVREGEAALFADGKPAGAPVSYGTPPAAGQVGFLHYFRYDYAYRNVRLIPLDPRSLPPPPRPAVKVAAGGVVHLTWAEPEEWAGMLAYEVQRDASPAFARPKRLGTTRVPRFADRSAATGRHYWYRVRARAGDAPAGPTSPGVSVTLTRAPAPRPPRALRAVRRIDGSVRLSWELQADGRAAWIAVRCPGKEVRLPAGATRCTDPAPGAAGYTVVAGDPDGKRPASASVRTVWPVPPVSTAGSFPRGHPRLLMTAAEAARIRRATSVDGPAREFLRTLVRRAEGLAARPVALPQPGDTKHWDLTRDVRDLALAGLLSGEARLADHAKAIVLAYAAQYPHWAWNNRRCRALTQSPLYEAIWAVPLLHAYDLLLGTGRVSPEERRTIERELLPLVVANFRIDNFRSDPRIADLHYRCYNFQAWHLAVTGLAGLLLGDADLVEWTLDSPYGFRHLLAHDIRDDGLFWERSLGYHGFVISALTNLTEAAWRCNMDLYSLQAADRVRRDEDCNYEVDGDNGPKSLARMFEAPFFFVFPDLSYANVADSGRGPLSADLEWRVAARRAPDPKLDWLTGRNSRPVAESWRGPADISGKVALSYDDEHLYVRAWVTDDVVRNPHTDPAQAWAGDLVWLALNTRPGPSAAYDFIYGLTPGEPGKVPPLAVQFNRPGSSEAKASAGRIAVSATPGPPSGYTLEAAIPLAEMGLKPAPGLKVAGEICLYDGDRAEGASVKEKMAGWNCRVDRYSPAEGGAFVFGGSAAERGVLPVPRETVVVDGRPGGPAPAYAARIGDARHMMTDASGAPDIGTLLLSLEAGSSVVGSLGGSGTAGRHAAVRPTTRTRTIGGHPTTQPPNHRATTHSARFANNGRFAWGSSLFPSSGFAILRAHPAVPWRQPRETLCANLNYGPYGGGHGHPDRLSLVLYALGRQWIPDFGSCDYDGALKGQWTAQTVSHNTVVVDGVSQHPTGDRDATWPSDTPQRKAMGRLRFFHSDPLLRAAGAFCDTVYDGVHLERTVAVAGPYCVDLYRVESAAEHGYDYVLHLDGEPESLPGLAPAGGALGTKCGYQHITGLSRGQADAGWQGAWRAMEGSLRVMLLAGGPTEVIAGRSITNAADTSMAVLIARRRAKATAFATVLAPVAPGGRAPALAPAEATGAAVALSASHGGGRDQVVLSAGRPWRAHGWQSDARAAMLRQSGDRRSLSLASCTRFRGAGLVVSASGPVGIHLTRTGSGAWRALNVGESTAAVTLNGARLRLPPGVRRPCLRGDERRVGVWGYGSGGVRG